MAVLRHAVENWTEFDAWMIAHGGLDPLEIPSRRLVAAAWAFLIEGMEMDVKESLIQELFGEEEIKTPKRVVEKGGVVLAPPKEKWRAPAGWTPKNWNEQKSYENAKAAMAFNANPG